MSESQRWILAKNDADTIVFKEAVQKALIHRGVSDFLGLRDLVFFWGVVFLSYAVLVASNFYWGACLIAFVLVAKAQNGLLLSGHEAVHKLLFRNLKLNDFSGQYLCFAPFGVGFYRARLSHIDHHHYLLSTRDEKLDQQLDFPGFGSFLKHVMAPLFGSYLVKFVGRFLGMKTKRRAQPEFTYPPKLVRADMWAICMTQLLFFIGLTLVDWRLYPFFWALPIVTLSAMLHNAKGFLDHLRWPNETEGMLYSYRPGRVDRIFFGIQQMNHAEHHLFPYIPYYRLGHLSESVDRLSMVRRRDGYFRSLLRFGRTMITPPRSQV